MQSTISHSFEAKLSKHSHSIRYPHLLPLIGYITIIIVMTWPAVTQLSTAYVGGRDDLLIHVWTYRWVKDALLSGQNPFYTTTMYFPEGVSLTTHNIAWLNIAVWLPLQAILGEIAAFGLIMLTIYVLNGFTLYLLAFEWTADRSSAFTAGLITATWPYTLSHYDHPNLIPIFWIPLILLFWERTMHTGRWSDTIKTAVCLALLGITRWQLLIMALFLITLHGLYTLTQHRAKLSWRTLQQLAAIGLLSAALMAPLATPIITTQLNDNTPEDIFFDEQQRGQTDLLAYILPNQYHPLWGNAIQPYYQNFDVNRVYTPFIGYTTLLLILIALITRWRKSWLWLLITLVYLAITLGPQLRLNGQLYDFWMPYTLLENNPLMRLTRRTDRFNVILSIPIAMLTTLALHHLRTRATSFKFFSFSIFQLLLAFLILLEYAPHPFPTTNPTTLTPTFYATPIHNSQFTIHNSQFTIHNSQFPTSAILDLPINPRAFDKFYMLYQLQHGRPLVSGHVSRLPSEATTFIDSTPFLTTLRQENRLDPALNNVTAALQPLNNANIEHIVLHRDFAGEDRLAAWQNWFPYHPIHTDNQLVVYHTQPQLGRDFTLTHPFLPNFGLINTQILAVENNLLTLRADWYTAEQPTQDYEICLQLHTTTQCQQPVLNTPTSTWPPNTIHRSYLLLPLPSSLPLAPSLTAHLRTPDGQTIHHPPLTIHHSPPTTHHPPPTTHHASPATFSHQITLEAHTLIQTTDTLQITLHWRGLQKMTNAYSIFLHVVDENGTIVTQHDGAPRNWSHPTVNWSIGELVEDPITLSLTDLPAGTYTLNLGLYNPANGQRLPVYDLSSTPYPDAILPLTTITINETP